MSTLGGYHDECEKKIKSTLGVFSTVEGTMMNVGEYHVVCREYHE